MGRMMTDKTDEEKDLITSYLSTMMFYKYQL